MTFYVVCAVIFTSVFSILGLFILFYLHSFQKTIDKINNTLDDTRMVLKNADNTLEKANIALDKINEDIPGILDDVQEITSNFKLISQEVEFELRRGIGKIENSAIPAVATASNVGNYVVKGYTLWKKVKRNRNRVPM